MSASDARRRSRGFSMVELLVVLVFMSILLAGMVRIFAGTTSGMYAGIETTAVQRNARWGLNLLQNQVLEAGLLIPIQTQPAGLQASPTCQPPVLVQATGYTPPGATAPVDEIQLFMDLPLDLQGTATAALTVGGTALPANIPSGGGQIQAGDMVFIQDPAAEFPLVASVTGSGSTVTLNLLASETAGLDPVTGTPLNSLSPGGGFRSPHNSGVPFTVIRPRQVVRFTVVPRLLDPTSAVPVPCLVRQVAPLTPSAIYSPALNTVQAGEQVLLENVTGFAADLSIDGGQTWIRQADPANRTSWTAISSALNNAIQASPSPFITTSGGVYNLGCSMWTVYTPLLFRITLTTRSINQRQEFNTAQNAAAPTAAYRYRTETLLLCPRNCGTGPT